MGHVRLEAHCSGDLHLSAERREFLGCQRARQFAAFVRSGFQIAGYPFEILCDLVAAYLPGDRVLQQLTELRVGKHFAEDVEHFVAQRPTLHLEFLQQCSQNVAFAGFGGDEIPEMAGVSLADPVDSTETLLEPVGVPRHVIVDHQMRHLEVDAFTRGICREKN